METLGTTRASLRDFIHVLFKRKTQILLFFSATVSIVAIASLVSKPTYKATSLILVKLGRENLYVPTVSSSGNSNPVISFNSEEQINSEIEILKSRFLAENVLTTLKPTAIYEDLKNKGQGPLNGLFRRVHARHTPVEAAILRLQKALKIEAIRKSKVIEVSFKHHTPAMAATVVNTLVYLYLDHHLQVHKSPYPYEFFQKQSQILKARLRKAEEKLKAFKKQHTVSSPDQERSILLRQEADLRAVLNQTLSQKAETENRISQLRKQMAATPKTILLNEEVDHNPLAINTLQAKLAELQINEKELLAKYAEQSRQVQNVRAAIQMVRKTLAEQEAKRYGKTASGLNTIYQSLQAELLRDQVELKASRAKIEIGAAQLADYKKKLEKLNSLEVEFNQLKDEVHVNRQNYQLYLTKFEESRISKAMDTEKIANVGLIEPARPPLKPVSPKVLFNLLLSVFLGGFGSLALAFFLEYLDDRLEKTEDVENYLQVPVLASIPRFRQ